MNSPLAVIHSSTNPRCSCCWINWRNEQVSGFRANMNSELRKYFVCYLGMGLLFTLVSCAYGDGGLQSVPGDDVVQKETRTETQKSRIAPGKYAGLISQIGHAGHARILAGVAP